MLQSHGQVLYSTSFESFSECFDFSPPHKSSSTRLDFTISPPPETSGKVAFFSRRVSPFLPSEMAIPQDNSSVPFALPCLRGAQPCSINFDAAVFFFPRDFLGGGWFFFFCGGGVFYGFSPRLCSPTWIWGFFPKISLHRTPPLFPLSTGSLSRLFRLGMADQSTMFPPP